MKLVYLAKKLYAQMSSRSAPMPTRLSVSFYPKTRVPNLEELEDLYLAALLNQKLNASTCSLPTDLVIWLLQQVIGAYGRSPTEQELKSFEKRMGAVYQRISRPTLRME
jgi:hypothetical protein